MHTLCKEGRSLLETVRQESLYGEAYLNKLRSQEEAVDPDAVQRTHLGGVLLRDGK